MESLEGSTADGPPPTPFSGFRILSDCGAKSPPGCFSPGTLTVVVAFPALFWLALLNIDLKYLFGAGVSCLSAFRNRTQLLPKAERISLDFFYRGLLMLLPLLADLVVMLIVCDSSL